jgi:hypothetical protein
MRSYRQQTLARGVSLAFVRGNPIASGSTSLSLALALRASALCSPHFAATQLISFARAKRTRGCEHRNIWSRTPALQPARAGGASRSQSSKRRNASRPTRWYKTTPRHARVFGVKTTTQIANPLTHVGTFEKLTCGARMTARRTTIIQSSVSHVDGLDQRVSCTTPRHVPESPTPKGPPTIFSHTSTITLRARWKNSKTLRRKDAI